MLQALPRLMTLSFKRSQDSCSRFFPCPNLLQETRALWLNLFHCSVSYFLSSLQDTSHLKHPLVVLKKWIQTSLRRQPQRSLAEPPAQHIHVSQSLCNRPRSSLEVEKCLAEVKRYLPRAERFLTDVKRCLMETES